eukprot:355400-Chlamydomonas_euryale.AAC.6
MTRRVPGSATGRRAAHPASLFRWRHASGGPPPGPRHHTCDGSVAAGPNKARRGKPGKVGVRKRGHSWCFCGSDSTRPSIVPVALPARPFLAPVVLTAHEQYLLLWFYQHGHPLQQLFVAPLLCQGVEGGASVGKRSRRTRGVFQALESLEALEVPSPGQMCSKP